MENPAVTRATKTTVRRKSRRRVAGRLTVDDLTNLSWVAGTPVPMDSSVSPPDGHKRAATKGAPIAHTDSSLKSIVLRKKLFKTPLPTYKIVLKDQKDQIDHSDSSNCSSPEKEDGAVIFANVMSEKPSDYCNNVDYDLLVDTMISSEDLDKEPCETISSNEKDLLLEEGFEEIKTKSSMKPNCSYTCLIGMALKASTGCLPVNAIYQYIEKEFPYFMTAPDGWKNSVRHNLSLNPIFRKVNPDGWFGKKGHLWEVCPNKQCIVDREIERYLNCTGKTLKKYSAPLKAGITRPRPIAKKHMVNKTAGRSPATKNLVLCSRCTKIVSPTKNETFSSHPSTSSPSSSSLDDSPNKEGMEEIRKYCQELKEEVKLCNIHVKPKLKDIDATLDSDECPLNQAGMTSAPDDPMQIAKDLFGVSSTPEQMISPMNYSGPFLPFYPHPAHYGIPFEGFSGAQTPYGSSSSSNSSPSPYNGSVAAYAMPVPFQYMMWHYPQLCSTLLAREMCNDSEDYSSMPMTPPTDAEMEKFSDHTGMRPDGGISSPKKRHSDTPDVSCLTSPLKRMKVHKDGLFTGEENRSTYFADISNNEMFLEGSPASGDDMQYAPLFFPIPPDFLSNLNYYSNDGNEALENLTAQARKDLDQLVGESDLRALLENSYRFLPKNGEAIAAKDNNSTLTNEERLALTNDCPEVVECMSSLDFENGESEVSSSQQKQPFCLPRLDSLLQLGDSTILTISSAMLDIQNTVEVLTAEDHTIVEENGEGNVSTITP